MPKMLLGLVILCLTVIAVGRTLNGSIGFLSDPNAATDFHAFWYQGQFLRPGTHWSYPPFGEYRGSIPPVLTPPLFFVISLLSYLPWVAAKAIWLSVMIALVSAIPWMLFRLVPWVLTATEKVLIVLLFFGFSGTSIAIRMGQPTIPVVALMLLTLILVNQKRTLIAGISFGLALSKISLAFPLLLYFVYKREWRVAFIGVVVQVLGFVGLSTLAQSPINEVISDFQAYTYSLSITSYVNLIHVSGHFQHTYGQFIAVGLVISVGLFGVLWWEILRHNVVSKELRDYSLFAFLNLWGLLVTYHQQYDIGVTIFSVGLLLGTITRPTAWGLSPFQTKFLAVATAGCLVAVVGLPGLTYFGLSLATWAPIRWKLMTIGIIGLLITQLWVWRHSIRAENYKNYDSGCSPWATRNSSRPKDQRP